MNEIKISMETKNMLDDLKEDNESYNHIIEKLITAIKMRRIDG